LYVVKAFHSLVVTMLVAAGVLVHGQAPADAPAAVPVDQEPRHHLVFSNDFVRIIDAVFPGFYVSQNHTHASDHVTVVIVSGRDDAQGQTRVGFAGFAKGGYTHVVTNPSPGSMRFIDVELRAADRGVGDDEAMAGHLVVLANSKVRIRRVKLAAGESIAEHRHVAGYVSVTVRGGDGAGVWKWHPSAEPGLRLEAGKQALEIVEIEPR
jgi:hypothetical protein